MGQTHDKMRMYFENLPKAKVHRISILPSSLDWMDLKVFLSGLLVWVGGFPFHVFLWNNDYRDEDEEPATKEEQGVSTEQLVVRTRHWLQAPFPMKQLIVYMWLWNTQNVVSLN